MFFIKKITLIAVITSFMLLSPVSADVIKLKIDDNVFDVELENNSATEELLKVLIERNVTVNASDYGNFEKVGDLGFSLPANDKYIKTSPGDIVLYDGDKISLFYDSNSWSYTKLGKIQNITDFKKSLGNGDVVLILSLK